jgi:hypothetical protein
MFPPSAHLWKRHMEKIGLPFFEYDEIICIDYRALLCSRMLTLMPFRVEGPAMRAKQPKLRKRLPSKAPEKEKSPSQSVRTPHPLHK